VPARSGLSPARSALQVTWPAGRPPGGVRADEVAEALGESVSTATTVLAGLMRIAMNFLIHRPAPS